MNLYAYMITKDEGDRYLREAIDSLRDQVDGLFVYDDQSTDDTVDILAELKIPHIIRSSQSPSFLEDESLFRQSAWERMEKMFAPKLGDWIITLDADEQLRSDHHLKEIASWAKDACQDGLWMHVHEMWAEGRIRTDGFWGDITALRFCAWKPNGEFKQSRMGGGSVPDFVTTVGQTRFADILHFGYFRPEERPQKMERYLTIPGHNIRHIRSIIQPPVLANLPDLI